MPGPSNDLLADPRYDIVRLVTPWRAALVEQRRANEKSWKYRESFASHRARQTELLTNAARGRLCVLGAGNGNDLDLEQLTRLYDEVHLVDIDGAALDRVLRRLSSQAAARVVRHAPVDLSGLERRIERWAALQATPEELLEYPSQTARDLAKRIGTSFDRVASTCLLSQLHLMLRQSLGASHPLFAAATYCLNLAHLRTLLELLAPGGRGWLTCDVASDEIAPLQPPESDRPLELLDELMARGDVFRAVDPRFVAAIAADDPVLEAHCRVAPPAAAWMWDNGPDRRFLVAALSLERVG